MSGAWKSALETDTPQAYHQFIRKHPDSEYVARAEERIEFHKIKRRPSLERFEAFRQSYPESELLAELRPLVEEQAFDAARAAGSVQAFEAFAQSFPDGALTRRAEGNAVFLAANGFAGRAEDLRAFATEHPESDFAAEAQRSVATLEARTETRFARIGLVIDIVPATPEVARLVKTFTEKAIEAYANTGVQLVVIPEIAPPDAPDVRLTIRHGEALERPSLTTGDVSRAGAVARTVVTLRADPQSEPIFSRTFELRLESHERIAGASMLFASKQATRYWDDFFVPVASWQSSAAVRSPIVLEKKATAVDAVLGRAVVLFSDGDFDLVGLSDPQAPVVLARYARHSKLENFDGIRIVGDRVILFGPDGLELVSFTPQGPKATATHSRGVVGSISALVSTPEGLLLASSQGLLLAEPNGSHPERLMRRMIRGLDALGETLIFSDDESVFVSTLAMLRQNRVVAQLRLGREFKAERIRVVDDSAIVMGQGGILMIDLSNPSKPRVVQKLPRQSSGLVYDAARVGDRIFLLGSRGVQVLDVAGGRVVEAIDVAPRHRIARTGRHLVVIGEKQLQVVDGLPFASRALQPASRASQ